MKWQTKLDWSFPEGRKVSYQSRVVFLGSCFADNLGDNFKTHQIPTILNPFGVIFNPVSLAKVLSLNTANWKPSRVVERDSKYVSLDAHSQIFENTPTALIQELSNATEELRKEITNATDLFITLGTAWAFEKEGEVVANCHKLDGKLFNKRLLSIEEMTTSLQSAMVGLLNINPLLNIYISVSPVRHTKNGLVGNNRSKARLIETAHSVVESIGNAVYLPAYELLMDELRDYRFYAEDLVHPSPQAVNFIIDFFKGQLFDSKTMQIYKLHQKINQLEGHRSLVNDSSTDEKVNSFKMQIETLLKN